MDSSPPGPSSHRMFQVRIVEWVAISFSRGSFWLRDQTWVSCIGRQFFTVWSTRETPKQSNPISNSTSESSIYYPGHHIPSLPEYTWETGSSPLIEGNMNIFAVHEYLLLQQVLNVFDACASCLRIFHYTFTIITALVNITAIITFRMYF